MSAKRKNTRPFRHIESSSSSRFQYFSPLERPVFDLAVMPAFDNGIKTEPSNVSEEISQQASVQNAICLPPPLGAASYSTAANFPGAAALPNGFVHHGGDSSQVVNQLQQWYKPPQQYNEDKASGGGDRHEASNGQQHKSGGGDNSSSAQQQQTSNTGGSSSGGNSRSNGKKKSNTKFKYTYQDRISGNVKYKCNTCEYCTNRSDHYKRHLLVHSEAKPFKCCRCGYCTGRSDHFRRHLTRHGFTVEEIRAQYLLNGIKTTQGSENNFRMKQQQQQQNNQQQQQQLPSLGGGNQQQQQQQQQQGNNTNHQHQHQQQQHQQQQQHHATTTTLQEQHQQLALHLHEHHAAAVAAAASASLNSSSGGGGGGGSGSSSSASSSSPKRHVCEQCGYATNRHSHFVRHSRTHSTERPYSCDHCGKRFKLDDYRKKHRCTGGNMLSPSSSSSTTTNPPTSSSKRSPNRSNSTPPQPQRQQQQMDKQVSMLPFPMPPASAQSLMGHFDTAAMGFTARTIPVGMDGGAPTRPVCTSCGMWFHRINDFNGHRCGSIPNM